MTSLRKFHLANQAGRNAVVVATSVGSKSDLVMGKDRQPAEFRKYIAAGRESLHEDLTARLKTEDYSAALISEDPEIDLELTGRFIESTQTVLLDSAGNPITYLPKPVEVTLDPAGNELSRRDPVDTAATVNSEVPIRWTGRRLPKVDVVRKFVIKRTLQLRHIDGVTFDFLFEMAKSLQEEGAMVLLGAGQDGKQPLVLQLNGVAYRGFLEGRVNDQSYILLLHLSNMELKRPAVSAGDEVD